MSLAHNISDDTIYRGQTKPVTLTFSTPTDITGQTIKLRFRRRRGGAAVLEKTMTITDSANGVATVTLSAAETDTLSAPSMAVDAWRTDSGYETPIAQATVTVADAVEAAS